LKYVYVGHLWFHLKPPKLPRWPTFGNHLTLKIELYTVTCVDVQFRVKRKVVDLESRCVTLSMNYSNCQLQQEILSVVLSCGEIMEIVYKSSGRPTKGVWKQKA